MYEPCIPVSVVTEPTTRLLSASHYRRWVALCAHAVRCCPDHGLIPANPHLARDQQLAVLAGALGTQKNHLERALKAMEALGLVEEPGDGAIRIPLLERAAGEAGGQDAGPSAGAQNGHRADGPDSRNGHGDVGPAHGADPMGGVKPGTERSQYSRTMSAIRAMESQIAALRDELRDPAAHAEAPGPGPGATLPAVASAPDAPLHATGNATQNATPGTVAPSRARIDPDNRSSIPNVSRIETKNLIDDRLSIGAGPGATASVAQATQSATPDATVPSGNKSDSHGHWMARQVAAVVAGLHDAGNERVHRKLLDLCERHGLMHLAGEALAETQARMADEGRLGVVEKPGAYYQKLLRAKLLRHEVFEAGGTRAERAEQAREAREELGLAADASEEDVRAAIRASILAGGEADLGPPEAPQNGPEDDSWDEETADPQEADADASAGGYVP